MELKLSAQQISEIAAHLKTNRQIGQPCACGNANKAIRDRAVLLPMVMGEAREEGIAAAALICQGCGKIDFYFLPAMGIAPQGV